MNSPASPLPDPTLQGLPSAFAAACHEARSDTELFDRCRQALIGRFHSDRIWFVINGASGATQLGSALTGFDTSVEVARCASGNTELVIRAEEAVAGAMRAAAMPLALGLSVVLELRSVLIGRQHALDDAVFQLRALRQVARLLSSVHSTEETEHLALDFMAEVFFAWWGTLYRPVGNDYLPLRRRSLRDEAPGGPIPRQAFDETLPPGWSVADLSDVGLRALLPPTTELVVPFDAGGERLAVLLLGPRMNGRPYGRGERELATTLAFAAAIALKNAELVDRLHSAATTDDLTGLFNRRAIEERLDAEISRSQRHQIRTTILLIDIDRFKVINDTLGHAVGDRYLSMFGRLLAQKIRTLDVAGRFGGDEFLVILPMTTAQEAQVFIARLLAGVETMGQEHPEFGHSTVSIGVAETTADPTTVEHLIAQADAALYAAKRSGRNAVRIAGAQ